MTAFREDDLIFMRRAIEIARAGLAQGQTPFGAVIVNGSGRVVAESHNEVILNTDITAHAEVQAIRKACHRSKEIHLEGCTIFSTCEPCPMCFSAIHWARIDRIVYGARIAHADDIGFNELTISNDQMKDLGGSPVSVQGGCLVDECVALFDEFKRLPSRALY